MQSLFIEKFNLEWHPEINAVIVVVDFGNGTEKEVSSIQCEKAPMWALEDSEIAKQNYRNWYLDTVDHLLFLGYKLS